MTPEEEEKLILASQKDHRAFSELYNRHFSQIYAYVFRRTLNQDTAEDITAVVFEEALKRINNFRWRKIRFSSFLFKLAERQIAAYYRKKSIRNRYTTTVSGDYDHADLTSPEGPTITRETIEKIHESLSKLQERDQEVIRLIYFEGKSREEVAELWGWSLNRVYVRLHRALKRLKKFLKDLELLTN